MEIGGMKVRIGLVLALVACLAFGGVFAPALAGPVKKCSWDTQTCLDYMVEKMQGKGKMHMSPEQMDAHMRAMQEHMLTMHDYSNKILAEKDPAKKEKLKAEQLELMKAHHMQMMAHRKQMKEMKQKQGK